MVFAYKDEAEILIAALPIAYSIWRYGLKPLWTATSRALVSIESISRLHTVVAELKADLKPNGGSSLRDAVDRVEKLVTTTNTAQKAILDLLNAGFFLTDAAGNCVHVNRYWQHLTGMPMDEALGTGWINTIHPEDRARVMEGWLAAAEECRTYSDNYRILNKTTGAEHWVHCHTVALRDAYGKVYGHIGTVVDQES